MLHRNMLVLQNLTHAIYVIRKHNNGISSLYLVVHLVLVFFFFPLFMPCLVFVNINQGRHYYEEIMYASRNEE